MTSNAAVVDKKAFVTVKYSSNHLYSDLQNYLFFYFISPINKRQYPGIILKSCFRVNIISTQR
ncbi:hypothetical protein EPIR_1931 [Erwinia piriflorinigrans CFBP 5888]|uniref:Uncharacterized protein n=1 Tax=Erwinia piriflorinigrans CFBP 5888 TaxID=1161919 RepID=V5Z8D2_9GAMM|nr:hypothetical protein EPIR_1931 [Erwinia piriflorinigrans CFBP 5888]